MHDKSRVKSVPRPWKVNSQITQTRLPLQGTGGQVTGINGRKKAQKRRNGEVGAFVALFRTGLTPPCAGQAWILRILFCFSAFPDERMKTKSLCEEPLPISIRRLHGLNVSRKDDQRR
jgi:hypothetical protein